MIYQRPLYFGRSRLYSYRTILESGSGRLLGAE